MKKKIQVVLILTGIVLYIIQTRNVVGCIVQCSMVPMLFDDTLEISYSHIE